MQTRDIKLLPIGATLFEFDMSIATLGNVSEVQLVRGSFFIKLIWVNIILALFNMIPMFPMDDG